MSAYMGAGGAAGAQSAPPPDDTLTLVVGGRRLAVWTDIDIGFGIERMPSSASVGLTERYPGQANDIVVKPGDPCQVMIGSDLLITGYIDQYRPAVAAGSHRVVIEVRGKCEDLVDCDAGIYPSAPVPTEQVLGHQFYSPGYTLRGMVVLSSSLLNLARDLASPFGIEVTSLTGDDIPLSGATSGAPVQFNIMLTEKPIEIISRVANYSAVLYYEGRNGNLILSKLGTAKHASGFEMGTNVLAAQAAFTMDQRFSIYLPSLLSTNQQFQDAGIVTATMPAVLDQGVPRFRPKIVVSGQTQYGLSLAQQCAGYEMQRRRGRSQAVTVTCDNWRDIDQMLWTPNMLAPVNIPELKIVNQLWLISEVNLVDNGDRGKVADVTLMPPEAFTTQPSSLQLYDWQVADALQNGAASGKDPNFNPRSHDGAGT
jgi:prophage tail gpP-like protein